jgi:hypothetical protein
MREDAATYVGAIFLGPFYLFKVKLIFLCGIQLVEENKKVGHLSTDL